ncbi:MAG: hypothetical protein COB53_12170 [Elusimicrobia bacterium]|nr:MAG: hypothetical protein COB53_12170 [Elusimicrobiota bacterium]
MLVLSASAAKKSSKKWAAVEATVVDQKGNPVEDAIVFTLDGTSSRKAKTIVMVMKDMDFAPKFVAVTVGDSVSFPNRDTTHHHVYSFSKIKKFDSRLYKDGKPKVVKFNKAGLVKAGCKIHDWMKGTILITTSDRRVFTDAGGVAVLKVARGKSVRLGIYHPRLRGKHTKHEVDVALRKGKGTASWKLKLKKKKKKKSTRNKVYY